MLRIDPESKALTAVIAGALLLIVAGTAMPLLHTGGAVYRYLYGAGALILLVSRLLSPYRGDSLRVKRLCRIEAWSGIMFSACTFFMFYKDAGPMDWLAFTLAGGVIQIYTSIMIPRAKERETAGNQKSKKS